jgi:multicomponent Na+:H+ antiporter subunit D
VPLPVLLPLLGAALTLVLGRAPVAQRVISVGALLGVVAVSATLMVQTELEGPQAIWIGGWPEPLGIALVADRLAAVMLLISSIVTLGVLVYSIGQGMVDDAESAPLSVYHPSFLVLTAGVSNAFLAGDLFNLFVSFEMLLFASYVLLTLGGTESRVRAGTIYVVVNVLSSMLFLAAIAMVYAATGSLNLAQLSVRLQDVPEPVTLVLQLMLLLTFGIKAAIFPLSAWLPDSYPTAPAPVTAVFAGLLTKVGVYAMLRVQTLLFPDSPLTELLLVVALATMLVGILGAISQSDIKRLLSFTLVSHIGYMVMGVALATPAGVAGAIFYVVHHITIQTTLFLVAGLIEHRTGSTSLLRLGGVARLSPLLAVLFFVPAMNLAGIPPFSGFLGKVGLTSAAIELGTPLAYTLVAGGMVTSLLTLYAVTKAWSLAFWRTPAEAHETAQAMRREGAVDADRQASDVTADDNEDDLYQLIERDALPRRRPRTMLGATSGLLAVSIALSVLAGPLFGYADRASRDLIDRDPYVTAVLPEELR